MMRTARPRLLNVGCGSRVHPDWVNIDVAATIEGVVVHDVRRGLPFPDRHFDAVYHSHVLEHLTAEQAGALLAECRRVLAGNGIVRVAVPDLEGIARAYLHALEEARRDVPGAPERHAWMILELLDQAARHESGGEVPRFLGRCGPAGREFAIHRCGAEIRALLAAGTTGDGPSTALPPVRHWPRLARRKALRALAGEAWVVGAFRMSGEVHRTMYDEFSLREALLAAGFHEVRIMSATDSSIEGWGRYLLDADVAGVPHKPDSIYVEARRS